MSLFNNIDEKFDEAYNKALSLLDYSLQTGKMLEEKLVKKGYSKETVKKVIARLESNEIINDRRYAEVFAENLSRVKYNGPGLIISKLRQKGINDEVARDVVKNIGMECDETEVAREFIAKNKLLIKRLLDKKQKDKVKLKLINNGFSLSTVNNVLKTINEILEIE